MEKIIHTFLQWGKKHARDGEEETKKNKKRENDGGRNKKAQRDVSSHFCYEHFIWELYVTASNVPVIGHTITAASLSQHPSLRFADAIYK
jgi:hypothetical protein